MNELSLMSWNVRYFGHGLKGLRTTTGWMRRIAQAIVSGERAPDLVALQEVETRSMRAGLGRPQLGRFLDMVHEEAALRGISKRWTPLYFPAHRYAVSRGPALYTTGLAILVSDHLVIEDHNTDSPHPITAYRLKRFAPIKQTRIAAHARVRDPSSGASLDLFNTHLSLPAFFEVGLEMPRQMGSGSNQLHEIQQVLSYIEQTRKAQHAVLVGDFNSSPWSPVYEAVRAHGLVDGFARAIGHDQDLMGRWSTARFFHHRMHIDHVFSTPGIDWLAWEPHTICRGGPFHGLSDHAPKIGLLTAA